MVASIKPHQEEAGLRDGLLLIDGEWRPASPARPGATATRPPARRWPRSPIAGPERRGRRGPRGPAGLRRGVLAAGQGDRPDPGAAPDRRPGPRARRRAAGAAGAGQQRADQLRVGLRDCRRVVADVFDHHAGWVDKLAGETLPPYQGGDHLVMTLREPVGVVGAVVPWNAPLLLSAQKLAPALAAGCTVVLKPSEYATFSVLRLVALIEEAGLPPGVLNVVTGPGEPTGDALISHPMIEQALVHRQPGRRPQDHARRGRRVQAGQPGAGRQEPGAGVRRRGRVVGAPPSPWARSRSACPARSAWPRPGPWCTGTSPTSSWTWPR